MYRHKNKLCGIYAIRCLGNIKLYVGSSVSINERISNHKKTLENNRHRNPHLQRSYNKYGKEMFIYFIVELCSSEDLEIKEDEWMTKWDTINNGFNSQPATNKSGINSPWYGRKHTPETIEKLKIARSKRGPISEESRQKMIDSHIGKKQTDVAKKKVSIFNKGKIVSEETKEKMRIAQLGIKHSEETKIKIGNASRGRTCSDETKKKLSDSVKLAKLAIEIAKGVA